MISPASRVPLGLLGLAGLAGLTLIGTGCGDTTARQEAGSGVEIRLDTVAGVPVVRSSGAAPLWSLDTLLVLGSVGGGGEPAVDEFGSVPGVTVGPGGLLYVPDQLAHSVKVFRRDGTLARAFGREGQGPGEFVSLYSVAWVGDTLLSLDYGAGRVGLLSPEGDWLGTRPAMGRLSGSPADLRFFPVGPSEVYQMGFEAGDEGLMTTWVRHGPDTAVTMRPFADLPPTEVVECRFAGGIGWFDHRFTPRPRQHPAPGGGVWVGDPRSYRIALLDAEGDTARVVERDVRPHPVPDSAWQEVSEEFETWQEGWESADCDARAPARPEHAPFYRTFQVDLDGRLWVERLVEGGHLWEVFDAEGRLVGSVPGFDRNAERTATFLGSSDIAWVSADTALGVPRVHWATLGRESR